MAAGLLVPVLAAALLRPVAELRPSVLLLAAAAVALGTAAAVRLLPAAVDGGGGWRTGPRAGALVVAAGTAQVTVLITIGLAVAAVGRSLPPWGGAGTGPDLRWGWQLAPAVALAIGATVLLLPRNTRAVLATAGAVAVLLAVPAGWTASWPQAVPIDLVGGVALLLAVLARPSTPSVALRTRALGAAVLLGHGLLVALAAPSGALVALGVLAVVGLALAVRRGTARTGRWPVWVCWSGSSRCPGSRRWRCSPRAGRPGGRPGSRWPPPGCRWSRRSRPAATGWS